MRQAVGPKDDVHKTSSTTGGDWADEEGMMTNKRKESQRSFFLSSVKKMYEDDLRNGSLS